MLSVISIRQDFTGVVVESIRQNPIGGEVGDGVSHPLDVIAELAFPSGAVVLGIDDTFDKVLGLSINDERRWRGLVAVLKGIGEFRF